MSFDWRRRQSNIGDHQHTSDQILDEATGEVATSSDTYITEITNELVTNNTFVTELTEQELFLTEVVNNITQVEENNEYITQITENSTFVTNVNNITNNLLLTGGKLKETVLPTAVLDVPVLFVIDGGGSAITTGVKGDIYIPWGGAIVAARLFADQTGSIVIDLWKDTYANFPPTVADTITASAKPTLSSAAKSELTTLTGWTTAVAAGQILRVNVDSVATLTRVTLALTIRKTI